MKITKSGGLPSRELNRLRRLVIIAASVGSLSLFLVFFIAASNLENTAKLTGAAGAAALFLITCFYSYRRQTAILTGDADCGDDQALEDKMLALDEAHQFFGTSLQPSDMFRLISSRVSDIFPHEACVLFLIDEDNGDLKVIHSDGRNSGLFENFAIGINEGVAGRSVSNRSLEITDAIHLEQSTMPKNSLDGFRSAAAIPLFYQEEVFGVFMLYTNIRITPDSVRLLEAVGERVAPIFRGSIAFERSLANAMTDPLTNLPNERAFFMVLENQLAESQRYREDRPLTVLAIDVKNFADANLNFGHSTGDKLLEFAAKLVKEQLRKMDFLARSVDDEFVIILPTASEKIALEIVERIKESFADNPFAISEGGNVKIELNFGWAAFWRDGETAQQLLQNARLRKQQAKSAEPSKVLWFPKEYVN